MSGSVNTFQAADYGLFGASLALSAGVGIFYAIKDRKKNDTKDIFLGGRNMSAIPVALSLLASFQSAISIVGVPSETYYFDSMFLWANVGAFPMSIMAIYIYVPVFYNLGVTSSFEYLSLRFGTGVRTLTSVLFTIQMLMYMAVVLYAPALGLSAVTGLPLWPVVIVVGVVCIFYTTIGGMKAVVWTDTFQMVVILAGLLAVLIQGSIEVGGIAKAWETANANGRIRILDFSVDPTVRHTAWSLSIGGAFTSLAVYGTNQAQIQRACALPTLKKAQLAYWLNVPGLIISGVLYVLIGIVMFAYYSTCAPILSGKIDKSDQILPLFVMDVLGKFPGLPGLFVACIFSGALSTLSSGLNALAAVALQDMVGPFCFPKMKERTASLAAKGLALLFGLVCLGLTYVASLLGNVLTTAITLFGIIGGPILGVFTLGMLFPWSNKYGAFAGLLTSLALTMWIGISAQVVRIPIKPEPTPLRMDGCVNFTAPVNVTAASPEPLDPLVGLYGLSYQYYALFALIINLTVGMTVSAITGFTKTSELNPDLICPIFDIFLPCLPERILRKLRFGVHKKEDYKVSDVVKNTDMEVPPPDDNERYQNSKL